MPIWEPITLFQLKFHLPFHILVRAVVASRKAPVTLISNMKRILTYCRVGRWFLEVKETSRTNNTYFDIHILISSLLDSGVVARDRGATALQS